MQSVVCRLLVSVVLGNIWVSTVSGDQPPPAPVERSTTVDLDPAFVYRFDPITESFSPIERADRKPGCVYRRHNPQLGRWVWSRATADGGLEYSMGPGSVQPAWRFDLTATPEERRRALEARAPEIARLYDVQGARAAVILGGDDTWQLHGVTTTGRIFDLETGERWEWHDERRVGIVHPGGNAWQWRDGRYVPASVIVVAGGGTRP